MNIILTSGQTYTIDRMSMRSTSPRVSQFTFGDGYTQRTRRGLNPLEEAFDVTFNNRPREEIDSLVDFFETMGGVDPFGFAAPGAPKLDITANFFATYLTRTAGSSMSLLGKPDFILVNSASNKGSFKVDKSLTSGNSVHIYDATFSTASADISTIHPAVGVICQEWEVIYIQPTVYSLSCNLIRTYQP